MEDSKVVVFKIENENYAIDIMQVERILEYQEPVKIPDAPAYIKGVIKYQGNILPVMDLKKRFNLSYTEIKETPKIVVVKNEDERIGLIVDVVKEVSDVDADSVEEPPEIVKGISNKYLRGIIKLKDDIIILIDSQKILSVEEIKDISKIAE